MAKLSVGLKVGILVGALVLVGAAVVVISLATLRQSVALYYMPSVAMAPTLLPGDHMAVNKNAYLRREARRGDVVVLKSPPEAHQNEKLFTERVIAIPGDTARITPGYVLVGNEQYQHKDLRHALQQLSTVRIKAGRVHEDGKIVPDWEVAALAGLPGEPVRVERDGRTGLSRAVIGSEANPIIYYEHLLPALLEKRHFIKLAGGDIYRDGKKVDQRELAELVGSPKARVKVVPGVVYLNGKPFKEPYIAEDPDLPYPLPNTNPDWIVTTKIGKERVRSVRIPKGRLLVMGDNRNDSNDSRFWGLLDRKRVIGKVTSIYSPAERSGPVR